MPSWQGNKDWKREVGLERKEGKRTGPLSGEESSCTDPVFDFLTPKGVYNMGESVSEMFIYFYVNRVVGALSISQF